MKLDFWQTADQVDTIILRILKFKAATISLMANYNYRTMFNKITI